MNFDKAVQEQMVLRMSDPAFMAEVSRVLTPDLFHVTLEPVVGDILEHWRNHGTCLSIAQITAICHKHDVKLTSQTLTGCATWDKQELLKFRDYRMLRRSFSQGIELLEEGRFDEARDAVVTCPAVPLDIQPNLLGNPSCVETGRRGHISTGLGPMDLAFDGGTCPGELSVILAPTSGGKSSLLVSIGAAALNRGLSVYHVTLEDTQMQTLLKYQRNLLGSRDVSGWSTKERELLDKGADLRILYKSSREVSTSQLLQLVPKDTDIVIVDYMDYLAPPKGSQGVKYDDLGDIAIGLKTLGVKLDVPVWTASQINRAGYEKCWAGVEDVEGSLRKVMVADQVISINQDIMQKGCDPQTGESGADIVCVKNRHGSRYWRLICKVNFGLCRFEPLTKEVEYL